MTITRNAEVVAFGGKNPLQPPVSIARLPFFSSADARTPSSVKYTVALGVTGIVTTPPTNTGITGLGEPTTRYTAHGGIIGPDGSEQFPLPDGTWILPSCIALVQTVPAGTTLSLAAVTAALRAKFETAVTQWRSAKREAVTVESALGASLAASRLTTTLGFLWRVDATPKWPTELVE